MIKLYCKICKKGFDVYPYRKKTAICCSPSCRGIYAGKIKLLNVKPRISTQGYYFIKKHNYHRSNKKGYAKIADIVLEKKIGRKLKYNEIAHHKNNNRIDDRPSNLEVMNKNEHDKKTTDERWKKWKKENRWSYKYKKCIKCKTINYKHSAKGYCKYCYKKYVERKK